MTRVIIKTKGDKARAWNAVLAKQRLLRDPTALYNAEVFNGHSICATSGHMVQILQCWMADYAKDMHC